MSEIFEFRGVDNLVYAEVTRDDNEQSGGYVTGTVKTLSAVAEIGRTTESSTESKYYDNKPRLIVNSTGPDEISITCAPLTLQTLADITGQTFDATKGCMIEGTRTEKYFAIGYRTKGTDGKYRYVWRYKGTFGIPEETYATENDGTDTNNTALTYTGIFTTHSFTNGGAAKALVVDNRLIGANVATFFDTVTTPDTLTPATTYSLAVTEATGTTVTVTRDGLTVTPGVDVLRAGDVLTISVTGGTITVNGSEFTSGSTHSVAANVTVVSTAQA